MTTAEKETLYNDINNASIQFGELMTLDEAKAYIKGFEDARNVCMDSIDKCYRNSVSCN